MLSTRQLLDLAVSLSTRRVLSVYVDGRVEDPAARASWKTLLRGRLSALRSSIATRSHTEREEFERCTRHLAQAVAQITGAIGAPGWVAFITREGIQYAERQSVPLPALLDWGIGIRVAPLLRAVGEVRVLVALVNSRKATVYLACNEALAVVATLHAHHPVGEVQHMGDTPRQGFHPGTRGRTGAEAASQAALVRRQRLIHELSALLVQHAGRDTCVLIGGTPKAAREAYAAVQPILADRVVLAEALAIAATPHEVKAAAAAASSALRRTRERTHVATVLERAGAHDKAVAGLEATRAAVSAGSVRELLISDTLVERRPGQAEELVRATIARGGMVNLVGGGGGDLLDTRAEGVAACARFPGGGVS